jgi:hypothetical protein
LGQGQRQRTEDHEGACVDFCWEGGHRRAVQLHVAAFQLGVDFHRQAARQEDIGVDKVLMLLANRSLKQRYWLEKPTGETVARDRVYAPGWHPRIQNCTRSA